MPELPEVETIRKDLAKKIVGEKIIDLQIKKPKLVKQNLTTFRKNLINSHIHSVQRKGKLLIFPLQKTHREKPERYLLIHLKMTGQLVYCQADNLIIGGHANNRREEIKILQQETKDFCQPGPYTHLVFHFQSSNKLFFNDLRQFGFLKTVTTAELRRIKSRYGLDPTATQFTLTNFRQILTGHSGQLKPFLLNQEKIAGLGNIYVDESLFAARLHPQTPVNQLNLNDQKRLYSAIKRIINRALKFRGTTFSDFVDANGRQGNFRQQLKVYGRAKQPCPRCRRLNRQSPPLIKKIKVAGRGTHFCPVCQQKSRDK